MGKRAWIWKELRKGVELDQSTVFEILKELINSNKYIVSQSKKKNNHEGIKGVQLTFLFMKAFLERLAEMGRSVLNVSNSISLAGVSLRWNKKLEGSQLKTTSPSLSANRV